MRIWPDVAEMMKKAAAITRLLPVWFLFMVKREVTVYVLPFPVSIDELKQRITSTLDNVTRDMVQHILQKLNNRFGVYHNTGGAYIKHLSIPE